MGRREGKKENGGKEGGKGGRERRSMVRRRDGGYNTIRKQNLNLPLLGWMLLYPARERTGGIYRDRRVERHSNILKTTWHL